MISKITNKPLLLFFLIFFASGFSGLIYESIWTHYLKLFLGHAAYSQALVLGIFMGGLALGSWVCSQYSSRWKNLLIGYALAEAAVGLFALVFHTLFEQAVQFSYNSVLPELASSTAAHAYKWAVSVLLILPQSILLGMTFPLMSAGIIRRWPQNTGKTISLLYFSNSLGAAVGVLVSGFVFIRLFGLPWTIRLAGLINVALSAFVWFLINRSVENADLNSAEPDYSQIRRLNRAKKSEKQNFDAAVSKVQDFSGRTWYRLLLFASFITGTASFIYEIGWIRMLSQVMGSSTHSFELMLSAFILGLALGGLWLQRRLDSLQTPQRYLAWVQVIMGLLALSTLPLWGATFDIMQWLMRTLDKTETGYLLFNLSGSAVALMVMLPTTFCAGMTLPLITDSLLRNGHGERSIGAVYGANTLGAILGVFLATHVVLPTFGLKGLITVGATCDIALGILLLWVAAGYAPKRQPAVMTAVSICAVAATLFLVNLDPYKMASGVYRTGMLLYPQLSEVITHNDGKTATISSYREKQSGVVTIATNGKPDASIGMDPNSPATTDEATATLLAVLPMALNPEAGNAANIGLGSGLTTHTLLCNPRLQRVDTVEIEEAVLGAAHNFFPRVQRAFSDERSRIFIDDAKTFFSIHNKKYDIIISEPSNPWVSGVAGLFSSEFYRQVNHHLTDNGLFAQWVQLYEINTDLVLSILKAVSTDFSDFAIYATNDQDLLIVAKKTGYLGLPDTRVLAIPEISSALTRINIRSIQDMEIRKIGTKAFFGKLLAATEIPANSDYYPVVDQNAARSRFLQENAFEISELMQGWLPLSEMLTGKVPLKETTDITLSPLFSQSQYVYTAMALRDYFLSGRFAARYGAVPTGIQALAASARSALYDCRNRTGPTGKEFDLYNAYINMVPYLKPPELEAVWKKIEASPCAASLSTDEINWMKLFKAVGRRDSVAMVSGALALLNGGQMLHPVAAKFLVASAMAGSLMQGDRDGSLRIWSSYQSTMAGAGRPELMFRLLIAESN